MAIGSVAHPLKTTPASMTTARLGWIAALLVLLAPGCSQQNGSSDGGVLDANGSGDTSGSVDSTDPGDGSSEGPDGGCFYQGPEICDGKDNDCNGHVDDQIVDNPHCLDVTKAGELMDGAELIAADDPENPTDRAGITLGHYSTRLRYLWAANHENNTVSKFNTETHEEEGIYWVGANPSRTAVDLDSNGWVGARDDGRLTHILSDTTACPDRNENGKVDTSYVDTDGTVVRVNSPADPLADECVVYSAVPHTNSIRGVAAAPDGTMWIGYTAGGIQSIDPQTHELGPYVPGTGIPLWRANAEGVMEDTGTTASDGGVYGMVIDSNGLLYIGPHTGRNRLPCYDTAKREWVATYERAAACSYGIAVDAKNRVWTGSYPDCTGVGLFDPAAKKFYTFGIPAAMTPAPKATSPALLVPGGGPGTGGKAAWSTTGVAVEPATGNAWTSFYQQGYTGRLVVDEDDLAASQWTLIGTTKQADGSPIAGVGVDLRGVGFDMAGFAWTLGTGSGRVWKIDPATNERATTLPDGKTIGIGTHYTYSDFTGSTALSFTAPRGYWRHAVEYPDECNTAELMHIEAHVPQDGRLSVRIRPLDTANKDWVPNEAADGSEWFSYPPGAVEHDIDLEPYADRLSGTRFEIDVLIETTTDFNARPILHALNVPPRACLH